MKAALVTGASKRIGADIALSLAERGLDIALHYHSTPPDSLVEEIRKVGVECRAYRADFADRRDVASLIEKVKGDFPALELLVNNASIFERAHIKDTEEDFFDRHFDINLRAPFFLSRDFANLIEKGHIINILDTRIARAGTAYAAYLLSKKALSELTRMAAVEFAPGIRVNAVAPGLILPPDGEGDAYIEGLAAKLPLKRRGDTKDVVTAINYLVDSEFVTGEILFIDGGEQLR